MSGPRARSWHALARICRDLGGRLVLLAHRDFDDLLENDDGDIGVPLSAGSRYEYGVDWMRKRVYAVQGTPHIGFVIHEAGHVFADKYPPDHARCDEWRWLGWEIAVARRIGAYRAWSSQNCSYRLGDGIGGGIGTNKDWSELTARQRRTVIEDRLAHARSAGLVDADGRPGSLR